MGCGRVGGGSKHDGQDDLPGGGFGRWVLF